jgi:hypothetical protein
MMTSELYSVLNLFQEFTTEFHRGAECFEFGRTHINNWSSYAIYTTPYY